MSIIHPIAVDLLKQLLSYNPEEGELVWLPRDRSMFKTEQSWKTWNTVHGWQPALTHVDTKGYRRGTIFRRRYFHHRVSFALHTGAWPLGEIDHINGDRADNRAENLRDVTRVENTKNLKMSHRNSSGFTGVYWDIKTRKWEATITIDRKKKRLGYFSQIEDAAKARRDAQKRLGFTDRHGL